MQVNMYSCLLHDNIPTRDVYNKSLRLYSQTDLVQISSLEEICNQLVQSNSNANPVNNIRINNVFKRQRNPQIR